MRRWTKFLLAAIIIIAALGGGILISRGVEQRQMEQVGALLTQAWPETVVASYNGADVTAGDVQYWLALNGLADPAIRDTSIDAQDILDRLLTDKIIVAEAERLGVAPDEAEVAEFIAYQKEMYETYPEAAQSIDDYCAGAEMTLEEYWAMFESTAKVILTKQYYRVYFNEQYAAAQSSNAVESSPGSAALSDAYQAHCRQLLADKQSEITYYDLSDPLA